MMVPVNADGLHEASEAIEQGSRAGTRMIRAFRGHQFFLLWGVLWVLMPLTFEYLPPERWWACGALGTLGGVSTGALIWRQSGRFQKRPEPRFYAALCGLAAAGLLGLAILAPADIGEAGAKARYAYVSLLAMACYVLAGAWFRYSLYWFGLAMIAATALGFFVFHRVFWYWMSAATGLPIIILGLVTRLR